MLTSGAVATPISYYFMQKWLADFAYHIRIGPLILITAVGIAVLIAWLTVSYHSLRAATSNPVKALRYE